MSEPKRRRPPRRTTLYFAVIDGEDPNTWSLFKKKFPEVVKEASDAAKPYMVPTRLLDLFQVEVKPLLLGPDALMEEENLDKIVGVIIDALPTEKKEEAFFERKLDLLKSLYYKQVERTDQPLFRKFGYKVWFATNDTKSEVITRFVESVRDALEAQIRDKDMVKYDYIVSEGILTYLMTQCLHDAYFVLAKGPN